MIDDGLDQADDPAWLTPTVGQVWQSWDVRDRPDGGIRFRITAISDTHAEVVYESDGRKRRPIKLSRLKPNATGYRRTS